jgi:hypothetical protein
MHHPFRTGLLLLLIMAVAACGKSDGTTEEATGPQKTKSVADQKLDCPDCDPTGANAFKQAGFTTRFYKAGDSWFVAWRYFQRNDMNMVEQFKGADQETQRLEITPMYLFRYDVLDIRTDQVDGVNREIATIQITQAADPDLESFGQTKQELGQERLDSHEHMLVFEMDDLLRPISETMYSRLYPNGQVVFNDLKSSLKTGSNLFPKTIPRVYANKGAEGTPELPAELNNVAQQMDPNFTKQTYRHYSFDDTGDQVYWRDGDVWPFYVRTLEGEGVLIRQNLAN